MPSDRAPLSRRRWAQRLLLAGSPWVAAAASAAERRSVPAARGGALRLEIGVAESEGSGRQALARQLAERLGRRLGHPGALQPLSALDEDERTAWLLSPPGLPRVLLASRWPADGPLAAGVRSIAVLAREPLVLLAGRPLPTDLAAVRAGAAAGRWRCGVDASDPAARNAAMSLLQALGLIPATLTVDFRGATQLLPAIVGGRIELAVRTVGVYLGPAWTALAPDDAAGNLVDVVTAHRRGDLRLLAVADRRRLPGAAEVPTLDELLGRATDLRPAEPNPNEIGRCLHLLAPADLPKDLARRLASAVAGLHSDPP